MAVLSALVKAVAHCLRSSARSHSRDASWVDAEPLEGRLVLSADPTIGVNLDRVEDWSSAWVFRDVFQHSRPWVSVSYNADTGGSTKWGDGTVETDAYGWPTHLAEWTNETGMRMRQKAATLMFRGIGTRYPGGRYRAEWEGTGRVSFAFAARVVESGNADGRHYAILDVTPSDSGIYFSIDETDPADPIRNVHIWMPPYQGEDLAGQIWRPGAEPSPFHPLYLERLQGLKVLRFMDWTKTNSNDITIWSQRPTPDDATQAGAAGVAFEYMVELCNELDADPWLTMPYGADDDFIRNYATLVRDSLEPDRKVYIEWANEAWNWAPGFETYHWVTNELAKPENQGLTRWQLVAREAKRDFDIWSEVFAGQSDRLVRVVAGQAASSGIADQILRNMDGAFDAISMGGYIYSDETKLSASSTGHDVAQATLDSVPKAIGYFGKHKELVDRYSALLGRDIRLVVYEGGQHLTGGKASPQAYVDAQSDPLMYEAYQRLLSGFRDAGGDAFLHFSYVYRPTPYGSWGALQYQDQPASEAPKYQALLDAVSGKLYGDPPAGPDITGDGHIDGDDYFLLDMDYLSGDVPSAAGDFNQDGRIDGDDYLVIDAAFLAQAAVLPASAAMVRALEAAPQIDSLLDLEPASVDETSHEPVHPGR